VRGRCRIAQPTIAVGRRGWSSVRVLTLGSVSNRLVHRADYPVLLVC
jgi:nucleotide-binding universal stress UspA family protein